VRNIGKWDRKTPAGTLRFNNVTVPADGTYTLVFFYVHLDDQPNRTAVITVAGQEPFSVSVVGATCCASRTVLVALRKGSNAITLGNPAGHAPSIDKIVISAR